MKLTVTITFKRVVFDCVLSLLRVFFVCANPVRGLHVGHVTSHVGHVTSHMGPVTSHVGPVTSHVGPVTSHVGRVTSHVGPVTSHVASVYLLCVSCVSSQSLW